MIHLGSRDYGKNSYFINLRLKFTKLTILVLYFKNHSTKLVSEKFSNFGMIQYNVGRKEAKLKIISHNIINLKKDFKK